MATDEASSRDLAVKIEEARRQRLEQQRTTGRSLGEQLAGEEMDSAAAWVMKSRGQEELRKERKKELKAMRKAGSGGSAAAALQAARYDEEEGLLDDGQSSLAGAVVGHSADDFKAGESMILTLADQSVLAEGEGGGYALNEDAEMLENVNLSEEWRRKRVKDLARGSTGDSLAGRYSHIDVNGDGKAILSKYDAEENYKRATITLDKSGTVDEAKQRRLAEIRSPARREQRRRRRQRRRRCDEARPVRRRREREARFGSMLGGQDYMSVEETRGGDDAAFRRRGGAASAGGDGGGKAAKPERKKKLRRKHASAADEAAESGGAGGLDYDAMAAEAAMSGGGDHGSAADRRSRVSDREAAAAERRVEQRGRYDRALASAEERSRAMEREGNPLVKQEAAGGADVAAATEEGAGAEVDPELYAALSRARRLDEKKAAGGAAAKRSGAAVDDPAALRVAAMLRQANRAGSTAAQRGGGGDGAGGRAGEGEGGVELGALEFSETGEFLHVVRPADERAGEEDLPLRSS